jgi:hypothetical protein
MQNEKFNKTRCYLVLFLLAFLTIRTSADSLASDPFSSEDSITLGTTIRFNKVFAKTGSKGWYGNEEPVPSDGFVTSIRINAAESGLITFGIGLVDQNNIFILEREFSKKLKSGVNSISLNEKIRSGQQIFIKTPAMPIRYYDGEAGKILFTKDGYGSGLSVIKNARLSFIYTVKPSKGVMPSSPETTVSTSGKTAYKHALIIGNSITRHSIAPFWWGNWGMAASTREKDFVHVLVSRLRSRNPKMDFSILQAANWERNHNTFQLSSYDSLFINKPDLVIIRLGENVKEMQGFEQSYLRFIQYIKEKSPAARIVASGNFWTNEAKDLAIINAAKTAGILFIPLSELDIRENKSAIGAIVTGDDGMQHTVDHNGVANHPGDEGMKQIAEKIYQHLP